MKDVAQDNRMAIATTILAQLGGHKFVVMTGAKNLLALGAETQPDYAGLRFRLPGAGGRTKNGINLVTITLLPSDTYHLRFEKSRRGKFGFTSKTIAEHDGIYDDQLQEIFTRETGLDTHL